ncbi:serine protease HTRA4-like [Oppia nitens]|uniref:serine protease HTRA4-like n=1 Tax=Oppia nitens TaxID=1686743 RepID=UPI0023DCE47F|nr:serine protease HTRA4-like [Oppia nitens]
MYRLLDKIYAKIFSKKLLVSLSAITAFNWQSFNRNRQNIKLRAQVCMRCSYLMDERIEKLYNEWNGSMVKIWIYSMSDTNASRLGSGAGCLVDSRDGLILTNYHVVRNSIDVLVEMSQKYPKSDLLVSVGQTSGDNDMIQQIAGRVLYVEPQYELALINLCNYKSNALRAFELSATDPELGDDVILFGNPRIKNTIQAGVIHSISAKGQITACFLFNENICIDQDYLFTQHSATGWPGSSGGPLMDMNGRVVGVHFGAVEQKINLAAKSMDIIAFLGRSQQFLDNDYITIQNDRQNRCKRHNSLGLILLGFVINGFTFGDTDVRNQLQLNDIITSVNGSPIRFIKQLTDALNNLTEDNQTIQLTVLRETRTETGKRRAEELDANIKANTSYNWFYL